MKKIIIEYEDDENELEELIQSIKKLGNGDGVNHIKSIKVEEIKEIKEDITLPIEKGDEIKTGKFLNKRTIVKTIGKDDHNMPTVNGKSITRIRIPKIDKTVKESFINKIINEAKQF